MSSGLFSVLTTIQEPTSSVLRLSEKLAAVGAELIVVGDRKGPTQFNVPGARLLTLHDQIQSPFELGRQLPVDHYSRKNIGYLAAIQQNATCIYETDDDNAPNETWTPRGRMTQARSCAPRPWVNVYRLFSDEHIWPRGFPLERITDPSTYATDGSPDGDAEQQLFDAPIQQGLANGSPDIDAVWRLTLDRPFQFKQAPSVWLPAGTWSPFNSQTTWWWPQAYPLLYLPSYCSFRMTDIWRSFVAQRCVWAMGLGIVFHAPEADQERNQHNLLRDFEDEIPGYLNNQRIVTALAGLPLRAGEDAASDNLLRCYEELIRIGVIPEKEMPLLQAWVADLVSVRGD
jgi:hypothetical protein